MTRPVNALCEQCGKITDIEFKERFHPNKIKETFFKCEHCFYHYTSFVTNGRVRKLQRKIKSLIGPLNTDKRLKMQEQINQDMAQLKFNLINYGRADL